MIKISERELYKLAPCKIDFLFQHLSGNDYYTFNLSGIIKRGGSNNVLLYLDDKSELIWKNWYINILKQIYLKDGKTNKQICLSDATSGEPNNSKKLLFKVSCSDIVIIKKINRNNIMNTITSKIKKVFRKEPEKTFIEVGFINDNEEITSEGLEALNYILWNEKKDELKKLAEQINKEEIKKN